MSAPQLTTEAGVVGPPDIAVQRTADGTPLPVVHPGWPPGFFAEVIGVIDDVSFMRPPQPVVKGLLKWWD